MPGLLDTLEELFGTRDLYVVLDVEKGVGEGKIKKAYHKTSLKVHPDRAKPEDREEATKKFQALGGVYKILSDKGQAHDMFSRIFKIRIYNFFSTNYIHIM